MTKAVFVEGNNPAISQMFTKRGWTVVSNDVDADLICFSGGSDVSPMLYGERKEAATQCDPIRDQRCSDLFLDWVGTKPMVGICRGGQFLNVMCGGSLDQDVESHTKSHTAKVVDTGQIVEVTSTHHQMMIECKAHAEVLLTASEWGDRDVEAVYYEEDNCLCFQPHPEFCDIESDCTNLFFEFVENYCFEETS